jgi:hypothetical protein
MKKFLFPFKRNLLLEKRDNISISINRNQFILKSIDDDSLFVICDSERPQFEMINNYSYTQGYNNIRNKWSNIKLKIKDNLEQTNKFQSWLLDEAGNNIYGQYANFKKNLELFKFDEKGYAIEKWQLLGALPVNINFSTDLDYNHGFVDSHYMLEVELSIDKALLIC